MSVVAERPALINNIVITRDYNREGAYLVRLCVGGLWKMILVDDLFPVEGRGCLAFSKVSVGATGLATFRFRFLCNVILDFMGFASRVFV